MNRKNTHKRFVVGMSIFFFFALLVLPHAAWCEYPERPISFIIGTDPGGPADVIARAAAIGVERYLGKPVVTENKGGGGGTLAISLTAGAKPDGYLVCHTENNSIVDTALIQKVAYKPLKDITPIAAIHIGELAALVVRPDSPFKDFNSFKDYAKKNPGKVKYSSPGVGTAVHIAIEVMAAKEGLKLVHLPYKGSVPAMTALLGGHVDFCTGGTAWLNYARNGQLKPLVMYSRARLPEYPDIPTLKELGYDFVHDLYGVIVGPAGLPADVVKKLETAFKKGTETPEYKKAVESQNRDIVFLTSAELTQHLKEKWVRAERELKTAGVIKAPATEPY
jgi:tripartite-type tricarboxylate transporter receptor subunit TctC